MPIYEFRCKQCLSCFEALVWMSGDEDSVECPKCKGKDAERIMSACSTASGGSGGSGASDSHCGSSGRKFS